MLPVALSIMKNLLIYRKSEQAVLSLFGCGAHGTAIRFVMEHGGLGLLDGGGAGRTVGMTVPREVAARKSQQNRIAPGEIMLASAYRNHSTIACSNSYLKRRGLVEKSPCVWYRYATGWQNLQAIYENYQGMVCWNPA